MHSLLKNPANGGIPAIENSTILKAQAIVKLRLDKDVQFTKYLGNGFFRPVSMKIEKIDRLIKV
jgi:hypothetical protein